jgi:cysteinyl-tRNA synthetase
VSLHLYDSARASVREFEPLQPGRAGIYVCGATPQAGPHIGHVRSQVSFDVLRRWLTRSGYHVTYVRNVTDIDDKILARAETTGQPWWALALAFEREFEAAYAALNVLPPTYTPRATGHITQMVELIARLVEAGHAYPAADGSGDVYFDVRSWPAYGELTRQRLDDMAEAADADPRGKHDPRDFALWKGAKAGEPETAAWPTPWGRGRPGWHLECSAMATRYLGAEFDIHGGGLDLRFPHHENEQAQSRAVGDGFSRYWLHNAWVVQGGEKMSKSLGNTMKIEVLLSHLPAAAVRYLLAAPHYRSHIEVTEESLVEARTAYARIQGFVARVAELAGEALTGGQGAPVDLAAVPLPPAFVTAMDDDLGTPAAIAAIHDTVRAGNTALAAGDKDGALARALAVRAMTDVLGIDPLDATWTGGGPAAADAVRETLDALVRAELAARAAARAARDFTTADAVRDRLVAAGIAVEDTPDGARWTLVSDQMGQTR